MLLHVKLRVKTQYINLCLKFSPVEWYCGLAITPDMHATFVKKSGTEISQRTMQF